MDVGRLFISAPHTYFTNSFTFRKDALESFVKLCTGVIRFNMSRVEIEIEFDGNSAITPDFLPSGSIKRLHDETVSIQLYTNEIHCNHEIDILLGLPVIPFNRCLCQLYQLIKDIK